MRSRTARNLVSVLQVARAQEQLELHAAHCVQCAWRGYVARSERRRRQVQPDLRRGRPTPTHPCQRTPAYPRTHGPRTHASTHTSTCPASVYSCPPSTHAADLAVTYCHVLLHAVTCCHMLSHAVTCCYTQLRVCGRRELTQQSFSKAPHEAREPDASPPLAPPSERSGALLRCSCVTSECGDTAADSNGCSAPPEYCRAPHAG